MDPLVGYVLSLFGVVAVVILSLFVYHRRMEQLLDVQRARDRIARDLHDDIASTLGSVSLFASSLKTHLKKPNPEVAQLLDKISSLSLDALDSLDDIVWAASPRHDSLNNMLVRMRDLLTSLCDAHGITYDTKIELVSEDIHLQPEVRKNIYLIFKESLNNIVKHSATHRVEARAGMTGDRFEMQIKDYGKGFLFVRSASGTSSVRVGHHLERGHGLRSMEKRAREIGAEFKIVSETGRGSTTRLSKKLE